MNANATHNQNKKKEIENKLCYRRMCTDCFYTSHKKPLAKGQTYMHTKGEREIERRRDGERERKTCIFLYKTLRVKTQIV